MFVCSFKEVLDWYTFFFFNIEVIFEFWTVCCTTVYLLKESVGAERLHCRSLNNVKAKISSYTRVRTWSEHSWTECTWTAGSRHHIHHHHHHLTDRCHSHHHHIRGGGGGAGHLHHHCWSAEPSTSSCNFQSSVSNPQCAQPNAGDCCVCQPGHNNRHSCTVF